MNRYTVRYQLPGKPVKVETLRLDEIRRLYLPGGPSSIEVLVLASDGLNLTEEWKRLRIGIGPAPVALGPWTIRYHGTQGSPQVETQPLAKIQAYFRGGVGSMEVVVPVYDTVLVTPRWFDMGWLGQVGAPVA